MAKVLVKFFQKLAGVGGAHENSVFFLIAFSFALLSSKEKAGKIFNMLFGYEYIADYTPKSS